jgi:peptide/nickel transport system substrate-binding protein
MKQRPAILLFLLAPIAIAATAESPRSGGQLTFALQAEPKTLDGLKAGDENSSLIRYLTGGMLIRLNRHTQQLEPELAISWKTAGAGKSIAFRLREGLSFSNGTPFRASDVCYTFGRLMDPSVDSPFADNFAAGKGKTTCQADGNYGVTLTFPIAINAVERLFDDIPIQSASAAKPESAAMGPFVVTEQQAGVYLILSRNPNYWKRDERGAKLPYLDSLRIEVQRNRDLELMRFRKGELHLVNNLDPESFDRVKSEMPDAARDLGVSIDAEQLWFNQVPSAPLPANKKAWFASREFRQAISLAISREDIVRVVYRGHASPASGIISPANKLWWNSSLKVPATDTAQALEKLRRDGFTFKDGVLKDRTGEPVEFSIITNSGNKSRERIAALIQQDLKAIGIRVTVVPLDFPSLISRITENFNYELCLLGVVISDTDPNGLGSVIESSGAGHAWNPNQKAPATDWEAELDKAMVAQASAADMAKRKAAFDRVQQIIADQAPILYLANRHSLVAAPARLGNFDPSILWPQILWNADHLYLRP